MTGSYYKGQWERGIQSGEGELYIPGEGVRKGLFVNNVFAGEARESLAASNVSSARGDGGGGNEDTVQDTHEIADAVEDSQPTQIDSMQA
jgi:hypothetical protein